MAYTLEDVIAGVKAARDTVTNMNLPITARRHFYDSIDRAVPSDEELAALIPTNLTQESILVPQDKQEERRKLSKDAWAEMIILLGMRDEMIYPAGTCPQIQGLFRVELERYGDPAEIAKYNGNLRQAAVSKDLARQAEIYEEHLQELNEYPVDDLLNASDQALSEQFPLLFDLYNTAKGASQLLNPNNTEDFIRHLSDEGMEGAKTLADKLPLLSVLMARYEMICSPCYEKVDFSKLPSDKASLERFSAIAAIQAKAGEAAASKANASKSAAAKAKAASNAAAAQAKAASNAAAAKTKAASEAAAAQENISADATVQEKAAIDEAAAKAKAASDEAEAKAKAASDEAEAKAKAAEEKAEAARKASAAQAMPSNVSSFLTQFSNLAYQQADLKLSRELQKRNIDLNRLRIVEPTGKEYTLNSTSDSRCTKAVQEGKQLLFLDDKGKHLILRQKKEGEIEFDPINPQPLVDEAVLNALNTGMDDLVELATGSLADPIWMVTGSAEYRDLKSALLDYNKLRKVIGHPPKVEFLGQLSDTLDHMEGSALNYLKHKDPTITDSTTFESYTAAKGSDLNMSPRELARLKAAFFTRDRAREIRSSVSLDLSLGPKKEKSESLTANDDNKIFYQGLLRKYIGMNAALDEVLATAAKEEEEHPEKLNHIQKLVTDIAMYEGDENPYPEDPTAILLWEMREMMNLIGRTESALGLYAQERKIDTQEKARIANAKKFNEKDPAELTVAELRAQFDRRIAAAAQEQTAKANAEQEQAAKKNQQKKGPRKPDYSPTEFVQDKMIIDSEIGFSNSSKEVKSFLNKNQGVLRSRSKKLLTHRIKSLERIEELDENNPSHHPTESYTVYRDGKPVEGAEPQLGDKIMLEGVHERRSQTTLNGCWSVSLCSQLEYRGVDLSQEEIRAYRPNEKNCAESDEGARYYQNEKQTIRSYAALTARVLPNSAMCMTHLSANDIQPGSPEYEQTKAQFRNTVFHALTKDNSPLSICAGGHYLTIVGMEGDKVHVKDPMHFFGGNPEGISTWSFQDLIKKGRGEMQLIWFADTEPTLGGNARPGNSVCEHGIFYANGRAYSNTGDEPTADQTVLQSAFDRTFPDGSTTAVKISQPLRMHYKRIPGSSYNADALEKMENALQDFSKDGEPFAKELKDVLTEAQKLQQGEYQKDPDVGMLALAAKYQAAYKAVKSALETNPSDSIKKLQDTLTDHLTQVRTAIIDQREAKYKILVGRYEFLLKGGNLDKRPDNLSQTSYNDRRDMYHNMNQAMAGMLYFRLARGADLGSTNWLTMLNPQAEKIGVDKMKTDTAFKNMVNDLYDEMDKFSFHLENNAESYKAYKEHLEKLAASNKKDQIMKQVGDYTGGLTQKEIQEKLNALEAERKEVFEKAGITEKMKKIDPSIKVGVYAARDLRGAMRSGNTDALFARYQKAVSKINAKNQAGKNVLQSVNERKEILKNAKANEKSTVNKT